MYPSSGRRGRLLTVPNRFLFLSAIHFHHPLSVSMPSKNRMITSACEYGLKQDVKIYFHKINHPGFSFLL